MLYVVLVALIMSVITAEALEAILDKKLAPLNQKIEDVNLSMSLINEKYEHMLKKFSTFDEERKELTNVNQALKMELQATTKKLQDLSAAHNDLEQYVRRECVEIRGIPLPSSQSKEDTNEIVLKVANLMDVDIEDRDISISHRLRNSESYKGKGNKCPPIIVKFVRRITKDKFYKARRKLNDLSTKDLGYPIAQRIFIAESLTQKNKELFKEAYQVRKDKQFKYIWTSSGKIFFRRNDTSPVLPIMGMNDLVKIKG